MSGKLPIDRVREARDAPKVYDEHRERLTEKQARLEQTDELAEGERPPRDPQDDWPKEVPAQGDTPAQEAEQ